MIASKQLEFDWSRGAKLGLIARVALPAIVRIAEGARSVGVKAATLKLLLRELDDFTGHKDGCWPLEKTLADRCCLPLRSLQRALKALEQLHLIEVVRFFDAACNRTRNRYILNWATIASDLPGHENLPCSAPSTSDARITNTAQDRSATRRGQSATAKDQSATGGGLQSAARGGQNCPIQPPTQTAPPYPPQCRGARRRSADRFVDWEQLRRILTEANVERIETCLAACRHRDIGTTELRVLVATAQANRHRFRRPWPNVLHARLVSGDWPVRVETLERIEARRQAAAAARQQQSPEDDASGEIEDLENRFGSTLDAMSLGELQALADSAPWLRFRGHLQLRSPLFRDALLEVLAYQTEYVQ